MMITMLLVQAALAAQSAPLSPPPEQELQLVCRGAGTARRIGSSTATAFDNEGHSAEATVLTERSEGFADQADLQLDGGGGRIRLPRTMLPRVHGGDGGWFELKNLVVSADAIDAETGVNFANHPRVHVDRRTGTISIEGKSGHFAGDCERVDPAAGRKF